MLAGELGRIPGGRGTSLPPPVGAVEADEVPRPLLPPPSAQAGLGRGCGLPLPVPSRSGRQAMTIIRVFFGESVFITFVSECCIWKKFFVDSESAEYRILRNINAIKIVLEFCTIFSVKVKFLTSG